MPNLMLPAPIRLPDRVVRFSIRTPQVTAIGLLEALARRFTY
jgi:hypothetical protein